MPEGDSVYRTAARLRSALEGATVRDVQTRVTQIRRLGAQRLVDQTIDAVESRGKHLLIWFAPQDLALHTHLGMTGSWRVYGQGAAPRKPERLVTIRIDVDDQTAVGFTLPTCELLARTQVDRHPALARLGPDALGDTDLGEARRRLDRLADRWVGEALLDQSVLAGVGNVYKCEVLFLCGVNPWTRVGDLEPSVRDALLATAERLLKENVRPGTWARVTTGSSPFDRARRGGRLWVYGRARRPCRRCGTALRVGRQGDHARVTYWCPRCQPDFRASV